jgi:hypothetical protein
MALDAVSARLLCAVFFGGALADVFFAGFVDFGLVVFFALAAAIGHSN